MTTPIPILLVRQRHDAKRAGLHGDYRIVIGDKAFSWASRKDFPEVGKPTILWEQPTHTPEYLNNPNIVIPDGQYGAGTQTIDYAQKGNALVESDAYHLDLNNGDRFLIKKAPESYGEKAWLFLRKKTVEQKNKYLEKVSSLGTKDMDRARSQINADRVEKGKSEIGHEDFKEQFEDRRGVSGRVIGTLGLGSLLPGIGLIPGYYLGKSVDNKNARKDMVLEHLQKKAALGTKDMVNARNQVNAKRVDQGKSEVGYSDFKDQFEDRRGVGKRVVGTVGLGLVGGKLRGPVGALVGGAIGYAAGKSMDNKTAKKNMIKEAAEEKKRNVAAYAALGSASASVGLNAASKPGMKKYNRFGDTTKKVFKKNSDAMMAHVEAGNMAGIERRMALTSSIVSKAHKVTPLANKLTALRRGSLLAGAAAVGLGVAGIHKAMEKKAERNSKTGTREALAGGLGALAVSKSPGKLLGYHTMYHGTSKANAKDILKKGLNKAYGGTRGSVITSHGEDVRKAFTDTAKEHVYMTKSRFAGTTFAGDSAKHLNKHGPTNKAAYEAAKEGVLKGKVLKARVSHNQFHKGFKMDPDSFDFGTRMTVPEDRLKAIAARSKHDIPAHQFAGGKGSKGALRFATKNNLGRYYKSGSGRARAVLGAAQLVGGSLAMAGSVLHNRATGGVLAKKDA